jgi:enediyne biosynthesis protein E4
LRGLAACGGIAWALTAIAVTSAQQGMGGPVRPARPVQKIETDLPPITVDFRDLAEQAGLTAANVSGSLDRKQYILEATGNGVAIFDFDNDGLPDIFLANASTLDPNDPRGASATAHLYRNRGALQFEDVTTRAGVADKGWGQGVCVGDYDNDGNRDLFVTHYGQSALYRNTGGTFENVTASAGLTAPALANAAPRWDAGCSFVDYDRDGRLDLVVTSYIDFDKSKVPAAGSGGYCRWKGLPVMCGPRGLPFARNHLFHNDGNGRFTDVSDASGIGKTRGCYGLTVVSSDFDNDGYPDFYVACDSTPSLLYHNKKNGTFEEVGLLSGAALNEDGQEQGGMGVAVVDYDEDGFMDIVKTNFSDDIPNLYHNNGDGTFEDRVLQSGLGGYMQYVGWGVHMVDVDHDGRRDLLMINGHVYPEAQQSPDIGYKQPRLFYWHVGNGKFKDISTSAGAAIGNKTWSSRGSAAGDLDNDGSIEIVVNNLDARPSLLKNFGTHKNWLLVKAIGTTANRDAIGARVKVFVGGRHLSAEVQSGSSYISQDDARLHFGLADDAAFDRIEVLWPRGDRESFPGGKANTIVTVTQGKGRAATLAVPTSGR